MPIEQLLALYNCVTPVQPAFTSSGPSKRRSKTSRNAGLDTSLMPPPETPKAPTDPTSSGTIQEETSENAATAETSTDTNAEKDTKTHTDSEIEAKTDVSNDEQIEAEETTMTMETTTATTKTTTATTAATTTTTSSKEIKEEQESEKVDVKQETGDSEINDKETNSKIDIKPDPDPSDNAQPNGQETKDDTDTPHVKGSFLSM